MTMNIAEAIAGLGAFAAAVGTYMGNTELAATGLGLFGLFYLGGKLSS